VLRKTEKPMPPHALVVSHGQPSDPQVGEREITALAAQISQHLPGWQIRGASLSGDQTLERAVARCAPGALVYPMFMADGWFTQSVLPKRLGRADLRILPPFGTDPALVDLATEAIRDVEPDVAQVFLAAHGSGKSPRPAEVTQAFGAELAKALGAEVRCGFVEEAPFLAEVAAGLEPGAVCLPFFATRRGHVLDDLPRALEEARFTGPRLDPIGCLPRIPAFIAKRLASA
jgi:sirohydrochlorin ferrochelatase